MTPMKRTILCVGLLLLVVFAARASQDDSSFAYVTSLPDPAFAATPNATATSPLDLDPLFGALGWRWGAPPADGGYSAIVDGLRVLPVTNPTAGGYYLFGRQRHAVYPEQYRVWISKINQFGSIDSTFGTNGYLTWYTGNEPIDILVIGKRAYVLFEGNWGDGVIPPIRARLACLDLNKATPTACSGWTAILGPFLDWGVGANGRIAAWAQRLVDDPRNDRMYVIARVESSTQDEIALAVAKEGNGALVPTAAGDYVYAQPSASMGANGELMVNAAVFVPAGSGAAPVLALGGQTRVPGAGRGDYDGFLMRFAPPPGAASSDIRDEFVYFESDNSGHKDDAVTALGVLRDGKLAWAGWSATDDPDQVPLIMGRVTAGGLARDFRFCAGNSGAPDAVLDKLACRIEDRILPNKQSLMPVAIGERWQNHDLVVVSRFVNMGPGVPHNVRSLTRQFSRNGNVRHAERVTDFPAAAGLAPWSRPFDATLAAERTYHDRQFVLIGTRHWADAPSTFQATVTSLVDTDSLFANDFSGPN